MSSGRNGWGGARATRFRRELGRLVEAGEAYCGICGRWIAPGSPWDVDHATPIDVHAGGLWDRANMRPAHRRCNRRAGARLGNRKRGRQGVRRPVPSRPCPGCGDPVLVAVGAWLCARCAEVVEAG